MNSTTKILAEARLLHRTALELVGAKVEGPSAVLLPSQRLLSLVAAGTKVPVVPAKASSPLLCGSYARLLKNVIIYNAEVEPWFALYSRAHEYGHLKLHHGQIHCAREDIVGDGAEDGVARAAKRVAGYGPRELREREAIAFARELLLPCDALRKLFIEDGLSAAELSKHSGMPLDLICRQLVKAILGAGAAEGAVTSGTDADTAPARPQDPSQVAAAHAPRGPLLIEAGPGTGKTKTLVGRILHLLASGVKPVNILSMSG